MTTDEFKPMRPSMRVVTTVQGFVFLSLGASKLLGLSMATQFLERLRLPHWTLLAVGVAEFLVGILVLNRKTHSYGALGIALMMIGAALTHIMTGVMLPMVFVNAALVVSAVWVVVKDRPFFLRVV